MDEVKARMPEVFTEHPDTAHWQSRRFVGISALKNLPTERRLSSPGPFRHRTGKTVLESTPEEAAYATQELHPWLFISSSAVGRAPASSLKVSSSLTLSSASS